MSKPLKIVLAVRDRDRAARLQAAFERARRPVSAVLDPFRQRALLQSPEAAEVLVLDGGEWERLHRRYRTFGARLPPETRVIVVVQEPELGGVLTFPQGIGGVIQLSPGEALRAEQIDLALAGYSCFDETGLSQLIGVASRRNVLETLRPNERYVLKLLGRGDSNREIAQTLGISEARAKSLVRVVLARLGVRNRTVAGVLAARLSGRRRDR